MIKRYSSRELMYHSLLSHNFDPADGNITSWVRSFLAIVLVTREPIPVEALTPLLLLACNPSEADQPLFRRTTRRLAQLFAVGDAKDRRIARPQRAFREVLAEQSSASPFFPDLHTREEIAATCLHIMAGELHSQGGWSPILLFFSVRLLLNHDKNTSSNPHFLLLLYIQNILVKSIQFGWCFYSIPYNEKMWVTAGVFVMI